MSSKEITGIIPNTLDKINKWDISIYVKNSMQSRNRRKHPQTDKGQLNGERLLSLYDQEQVKDVQSPLQFTIVLEELALQ